MKNGIHYLQLASRNAMISSRYSPKIATQSFLGLQNWRWDDVPRSPSLSIWDVYNPYLCKFFSFFFDPDFFQCFLGGGFKYCVFSFLLGKMFQFDYLIGWNQLVFQCFRTTSKSPRSGKHIARPSSVGSLVISVTNSYKVGPRSSYK